MSSVFAWVDFAEEDHRGMARVIDLFREEPEALESPGGCPPGRA